MGRFNIAEECHIVNILPPLDIDAAAQVSDYFSTKNAGSVQIILQLGVTGATAVLTIEESDDAAGSSTTAIAFNVYKEETAAGDTLGARTAVTSSGMTTSANDGIFYIVDIDPRDLTDGYPYLVAKLTDPGAATFGSAVAILGDLRYKGDPTPTAVT